MSASCEVFIQGGPPDPEPAGHLCLEHAIGHPPSGLSDQPRPLSGLGEVYLTAVGLTSVK